jgi:hypothetical protein
VVAEDVRGVSERRDGHKDLKESMREQHQLVFDACKHFTTLDTAMTLIVLVVSRELGVGLSAVVWPLFLFGASLLACIFGMLETAMGGQGASRRVISASNALFIGVLCFTVGLIYIVFYTISATP